jgi:hypothetical protein
MVAFRKPPQKRFSFKYLLCTLPSQTPKGDPDMRRFVFVVAMLAAVYIAMIACTTPTKPPVVVAPKPTPAPIATPAPTPKPVPAASLDPITSIAGNSACAKYSWNDRGRAPKGYMKGVAIAFAKAVCQPSRDDVIVVSQARQLPESQYDATDALSWYNSNFKNLGMSNDKSGVDTLRHTYALLLGLGMRESSGKYCCGRDMSADFSTADSAEAGVFQASWGARRVAPALMQAMLEKYKAGKENCHLDVFKEGVGTCSSANLKNWGEGDGVEWQRLTKQCPVYAAEYAAILLRKTGGTRGEFGPLRRKAAEIRPECDQMLKQVQDVVKAQPGLCDLL